MNIYNYKTRSYKNGFTLLFTLSTIFVLSVLTLAIQSEALIDTRTIKGLNNQILLESRIQSAAELVKPSALQLILLPSEDVKQNTTTLVTRDVRIVMGKLEYMDKVTVLFQTLTQPKAKL